MDEQADPVDEHHPRRAQRAHRLVDSSSNQTTVYDPDHNYQTKAVYTLTRADLTIELQTLTDYDDRHRMTKVKHQSCTLATGHACSSATTVAETDYLYDDNDNRTKVAENNGAATTDRRYVEDDNPRVEDETTTSFPLQSCAKEAGARACGRSPVAQTAV